MTNKEKIVCPCCGSDSVKITRDCPDDHGLHWDITYKCSQCGLQKSEENWKRMFTEEQCAVYPTFKDQLLKITAQNNVHHFESPHMYSISHHCNVRKFFDTRSEAEAAEYKHLAAHAEDVRYTAAERMGLIPSKFADSFVLDLFKDTSVLCHTNIEYENTKIHLRSECRSNTPYPEGYPPAPTIWEILLKLSEFGKTQLIIENNIITINVIDKSGKGQSICCPVNYPEITDVYINAAEAAIKLLEKSIRDKENSNERNH